MTKYRIVIIFGSLLLTVGFGFEIADAAEQTTQEVLIADNILGPDGPLYVDDALYFVSWGSPTKAGALSRWDGKSTTDVYTAPLGCVPNGLGFTKQHTFLIACFGDDSIIEVDMSGKQLRRWDADANGVRFGVRVADFAVAANGGIYVSLLGPLGPQPAAIGGKILYRAPGAENWKQVADAIDVANGIAISPDQKTLYVGETIGNAIKTFAISPDGSLGARANFALLDLFAKNKVQDWLLGPDGLKVDSQGNIYTAQWPGGRVFKISSSGKLLHVFEIRFGDGTTSLALGPDEKDIYVSVVKNSHDRNFVGAVIKIPNTN